MFDRTNKRSTPRTTPWNPAYEVQEETLVELALAEVLDAFV